MGRTLCLFAVTVLAALRATGQVNTINTIAGGAPQPNVATSAYLPQPVSAVRDTSGNTYISVPALNTVYLVSTAGALSVYAGNGIAGFSGDGGPAAQAQLNFPEGLAIDSGNNVFIADSVNQRIRRVDAQTHTITTVAGSEDPGFGNYSGDGGPATNARLNSPTDVAVDAKGNLFIADNVNGVVRRVDANTQVITTYAGTAGGNGTPGCNSGVATNAVFSNLIGVAADKFGNVFASDTKLDLVCKIDTNQNVSLYAGTIGNPGTSGSPNGDGGPATSAQIDRPTGLATDAGGNLYITDSGNPRIRKVDTSASNIITSIAGTGTICSNAAEPACGDGGAATAASLDFPNGVFVDANNNVVIADTNNMRVRVVNTATSIIANLAGGGSGGDNGPAASAILGLVQSLALDANENVFGIETAGERLRKIATTGNITTVAGTGFGGQSRNCAQPGCNGDGGPATSAQFVEPDGVASDAQGNFYILDFKAAALRVINNQVSPITIAGTQIQPGQIATVAGNATVCKPGSASYPTCGDGGAATSASLDQPAGVAVDSAGNIYISDQGLNTVREVSQATGVINTLAGTPGQACTTYSTTKCGNNGAPTAALLNFPQGVAVSPGLLGGVPQPGATDVFVVDSGDNVIRKISIVSGAAVIETISTAAFSGIPTYGGDGESTTLASSNSPSFIAVDNLENLYVGGGADNLVRRVDAFSGRVSTVAGDIMNLTGGFSGDGGPSTQAMIENSGLAVFNTSQGDHDLFIADSGSNRVRKVNLAPVSTFLPISGSALPFPITLDGQRNTQPLVIENSGLDDLVITNVTLSDTTDFSVTPSSCYGANPPIVLPPAGQVGVCILDVSFNPGPNANGVINATLTFTTNDPANPNLSYNLSGTATPTSFALSVTLTPAVGSGPGGSVISSPFGIDCFTSSSSGTCSAGFASGSTVTLIASPDSGFTFSAWGGACTGAVGTVCNVLMNQVQNVSATFTASTPPQMTINIVGLGSGTGTVSDGATLNCTITNGITSGTCSAVYPTSGSNVALTATAGTATTFVGWLGNTCAVYTNPCSVFPQAVTHVIGAVFTGPAQTFTKGQVFISTDFGMVFVVDAATGNVVQVLSSNPTTGRGEGLTFDTAGSLYLANSQANRVEQFAINGTGPALFGTGYQTPWSPLIDPSGNLLVGETGQFGDITVPPMVAQVSPGASSTTTPSFTFFPDSETLLTPAYWVELLDSGDTIAYTTGSTTVGVFDLAELAQHPDMITNLHGAFALRELPDDTILVADTDRIVRIDQNGNIKQTYTIPSVVAVFKNLNLDPDGLSFWTNDESTGILYRINIQTGAVMNGSGYGTGLASPAASGLFTQGIGGIAVFGQASSGGADLAITMQAPSSIQAGANIPYSVSVSDNGPLNATGVSLIVSIPNTTPVTVPNNCTATNNAQGTTVTCPIGNVSAKTTPVAVNFTMSPNSPGTITATATVSGNQSDPNLANNTATVTTSTGPTCTLSVVPNSGFNPLPVNATPNCSDAGGTIATETVNFGDGTPPVNVANGQPTAHVYSAAGTFTVTVTATDNLNLTGTATQTVTVSINQPPVCSNFSVAPLSGLAPLTVTANGTCSDPDGDILVTTLNFGDGTSPQSGSTGGHTYAAAGTFTVTLTATDAANNVATATKTVTVGSTTAPTCTLAVAPASGPAPLAVTATGACSGTNTIASTTLNFGDGTIANASSGTHTYAQAGVFTVTVTATDTFGLSGSATKTVTVGSNVAPTCTLTVAPVSGPAPLAVTATGACNGTNTIATTTLNFGDGTIANASSGTHTYAQAGVFTVTVTATDTFGLSGSATKTVTVGSNLAPACTLTVTPLAGQVPLAITATGNCTGTNPIATTLLDFGDGTTANASSGTHTYSQAGTFTVKITATDSFGLIGSAIQTVTATANSFPIGVFVGVSGGKILQFASDGTILKTFNTGVAGTVADMAFDKAGNLYTVDFTAGNVTELNLNSGTVIGPFGSGYNCQPESMVFDGAGNVYVGQQGCSLALLKFDPSGKPLTSFQVATEEQGSDDLALSADECTMLYTSEGQSILRYDVCHNQQLSPFATGLNKALNLRILPDGGVIVADLVDIVRLNSAGQKIMTYTAPGAQCLYGVALDQDGKTFWADDYCSSNVFHIDLTSGNVLSQFNTGTPSGTAFGLAISGTGLNVAGLGSGGALTATPQSATLGAGQSATFTVSLTPNALAAGKTITLSCAGLPPGLTCSFNPATITLGAAGTTTTATLTISRTTTAALMHPASPWMLATWMGMVPAIVLAGLRSPRRRRGSLLWLGIVVATSGIWASCGGGNSMSQSTTSRVTPQGSYTVIVVGTATGVQASTTVNITVP